VGERDYRGLVAELEAPVAYAERMDPNPVWHCPLRTAPGDRVLTDAEWAEVAADLMDRTGIAPRGDDGACRWIAVRHDEVSIHVVAVLARQDGGRAHVFRDYPQVRATCLAAEARYGLVVTAPADRTAATHTTRAEREKVGIVAFPDRDPDRAQPVQEPSRLPGRRRGVGPADGVRGGSGGAARRRAGVVRWRAAGGGLELAQAAGPLGRRRCNPGPAEQSDHGRRRPGR